MYSPTAMDITEERVVRYVPQWFPGAGFQKKAAHWKRVINLMVDLPWKYVKDGLVCTLIFCSNEMLTYYQLDGSAAPSIAAVLLEELPDGEARAEKEQIAKHCAGTALTGAFSLHLPKLFA